MNPVRKRLFHTYARLRRPMTLGARAIVENDRGEVCFVRHTYMRGWYLPGGGIERAETALKAITRELEEEAGVKLTGHADIVGFGDGRNLGVKRAPLRIRDIAIFNQI